MQDHVLEHCRRITQESRAEAQKHVKVTVNPTTGKRPPMSFSRTSIEKEKRQQLEGGQFLPEELSSQQQTAINRKLLKFLVINGISFRVINSPLFLAFVGSPNVNYNRAGRDHSDHPAALLSQLWIAAALAIMAS